MLLTHRTKFRTTNDQISTSCPSGGFSSNAVNCVTLVHDPDSLRINVPTVIDTFLLQHVQGRLCPGHVNIPQWDWERFSPRHIKLNSRFHVMTINVIPFDRPKIVCWLRLVRTSSKTTTELCSSEGLTPY